jgi:hypothetical protein
MVFGPRNTGADEWMDGHGKTHISFSRALLTVDKRREPHWHLHLSLYPPGIRQASHPAPPLLFFVSRHRHASLPLALVHIFTTRRTHAHSHTHTASNSCWTQRFDATKCSNLPYVNLHLINEACRRLTSGNHTHVPGSAGCPPIYSRNID